MFSLSLPFSSLITVCLDIDFFGFILFRVNWASCIYKFISFLKFRKLSAIISSKNILYTFSSTCELMMIWILDLLIFPIGPRGSVHSLPAFLCSLYWIVSIGLSSRLLTPALVLSILLLSPSSELLNFRYCNFQNYDFLLVLYYILNFIVETFYLSLHFKGIHHYFWGNFYKTALKSWVDNFNICVIWLSSPIQIAIFLVLHGQSNFLLDPGHFEYYVLRLWVLKILWEMVIFLF